MIFFAGWSGISYCTAGSSVKTMGFAFVFFVELQWILVITLRSAESACFDERGPCLNMIWGSFTSSILERVVGTVEGLVVAG